MDGTAPTLSGLAPLISIEELSEYLNVPTRTLYDWRLAGRGPRAVHVGRQLRYFVTDVNEWLEQQREDLTGRAPEGR
ncbi:helix-turn-helix domain-containing protein [Nocardioides carbamazepini]|nr:helix-turn-helix domain-containing protein [Nocardioides carbamazepini]